MIPDGGGGKVAAFLIMASLNVASKVAPLESGVNENGSELSYCEHISIADIGRSSTSSTHFDPLWVIALSSNHRHARSIGRNDCDARVLDDTEMQVEDPAVKHIYPKTVTRHSL